MVRFPQKNLNSGVILVMAALFVLLFLTLAGLSLGLGFIAYERSNFRRASNAAALAAVERFSQLRDDFAENPQGAQRLIEDRAWSFLDKNQPRGQIGGGGLKDKFELDISYGRVISQAPKFCDTSSSCPCDCDTEGDDAKYPCFVACSRGAEANAIKVRVASKNNSASGPILSPLGYLFGKESFELAGSSVGMIVPRCTAFLIDVSQSVVGETHDVAATGVRSWYYDDPNDLYDLASLIITPVYNALYAFRAGNIQTEHFYPGSPGRWSCADADELESGAEELYNNPGSRQERQRWCSLRRKRGPSHQPEGLNQTEWTPPWYPEADSIPEPYDGRPSLRDEVWRHKGWQNRDTDGNPFPAFPQPGLSKYAPKTHYRSDYKPRKTKYGDYLLDSYVDPDSVQSLSYSGPEPLQTFLHAFHSALITLKNQQTNQDLVMAKAFTGRIRDEIPCRSSNHAVPCAYSNPGDEALTNNLNYLIQITNFQNRGTVSVDALGQEVQVTDEISPNFLTHGWFPFWGTDGYENGTNLVKALIETIHDLERDCPSDYKKLIVLATDGMASCYVQNDAYGTEVCPQNKTDPNFGYQSYLNSENQLLSTQLAALYNKSVLDKLKEDEISLTVMLSGDYVEPNFCNVFKEEDDPAKGFLNVLEASGLGYSWNGADTATCASGSKSFFNVQPSGGDNAAAYRSADASRGILFRRPNGTLGRMVLETGGLWCPLQDLDDRPGAYEGGAGTKLKDGFRLANSPQTKSVLNYTKAQMAATCASAAVGYNPFTLIEPVN